MLKFVKQPEPAFNEDAFTVARHVVPAALRLLVHTDCASMVFAMNPLAQKDCVQSVLK